MAEELIPVNIIIADRSYRLKINASDEEIVRRTIKTLNEKIVDFKTNFAGKDMQDYVSMVLLWYATEQQKPVSTETATIEDKERLKKLEDLIDKTLIL